jgi:hypothetical protein
LLGATRRSGPEGRFDVSELATKTELADDGSVSLDVVVLQVIQKATALADEHEEPAATVVVLLVDLEMLGQVLDTTGEQCDLHLRRTSVGLMEAKLVNDCGVF